MATAKDNGELSAMLLPELKKVAGQLGIEDAATMKKGDLVSAIADLQAANREAAKAEREAKRAERDARRKGGNKNSNKSNSQSDQDGDDDGENQGSNPNDASDADVNKKEWVGNNSDRNDRGGRSDRHNRRDRGDRGDRNNRFRDRGNREEREIQISEDDVLLPVGGLLDILENYAFIRTGGYLPSPNDVYVSLQQVRRYGLRKGDVITGSVRQPREG